jgi:2-amino-4-hydroxy-6-hydroxymethyldihydropteridine diphosphokinase
MPEYIIGLGSNLGNRQRNIEDAIKILEQTMKLIKVSSLYESEPMYLKDQPWFVNCVVKFESELDPIKILKFLQDTEREMGRTRSVRYGPRIIDLDILFSGSAIIQSDTLKVPHPKIRERRFVLEPLAEIEPGFIHPVYRTSIAKLLRNLKSKETVRMIGKADL